MEFRFQGFESTDRLRRFASQTLERLEELGPVHTPLGLQGALERQPALFVATLTWRWNGQVYQTQGASPSPRNAIRKAELAAIQLIVSPGVSVPRISFSDDKSPQGVRSTKPQALPQLSETF